MEDLFNFPVMSLICKFLETSSFSLLTSLVVVAVTLCAVGVYVITGRCHVTSGRVGVVPESVNYHFTRHCNYKCGFCFHTAKSSFLLPIDEAKRGLQLLKNAGHNHVRTAFRGNVARGVGFFGGTGRERFSASHQWFAWLSVVCSASSVRICYLTEN